MDISDLSKEPVTTNNYENKETPPQRKEKPDQ
jgi:hypothetical protein